MWDHVEAQTFEMWLLKQQGASISVVRDHLDRDGTFTASIKRDGVVRILDERFASLEAAQAAAILAAQRN